MKIGRKSFEAGALAVVLAVVAFLGGQRLHSRAGVSEVFSSPSIQASALLKLTPEQSAVSADQLKAAKVSDTQYQDLLKTVLRLVRSHYVEKITSAEETKMAQGAVRSMLDSLGDPDTRYLDAKDHQLVKDAEAGRFHGIGAVLALKKEKLGQMESRILTVISPLPGSPAEQAGLRAGDQITDIGGKWIISHDPYQEPEIDKARRDFLNKQIDQYTYDIVLKKPEAKLKNGTTIVDALEQLTTKKSGDLSLKVDRPGKTEPLSVKLRCRDTVVNPVASRMLAHNVAYIRVSQFNKTAVSRFTSEFGSVQSKRPKAIILDLRNNAGGTIDAATQVAGKITGGGTLANVVEKSRRYAVRRPKTRSVDVPVVVLVNGGTASVAELVAGTMKDNLSATIVGTRTFGDGTVQTPLTLKDGSIALVTTGKMLTPKGTDFNGQGLAPDTVVDQKGRGDAQLTAAEEMLQSKLGTSRG